MCTNSTFKETRSSTSYCQLETRANPPRINASAISHRGFRASAARVKFRIRIRASCGMHFG